jgi:glycerol uptake facilitator protein
MHSPMFGEFMGTFVMILLGNGVVAGVLLKRSKAEGGGWLVITTGWAFAVMAGIFTAVACGSPDAHLNPAITVAFAIQSGSFAKVIPYAAAQLAGAIAGATLVWVHFWPHWRGTPDAEIKRACFCTSPAIRSTANNVTSEIIATFVLVFVVGAFSSKAVAALIPIGPLGPYLVSCLVWGIGLSLGGTTGYAINPARDLGPRIAHALLPISNKGHSDWAYAVVPIIGPLLGGCLAGGLIRFLQF